MGLSAAATAQGMATRHRKSIEAVVAQLVEVNALLAKMIKGNKIKWNGYGTYAEWYVRKLEEEASWQTGQLGTRTFEEKDCIAKCEVPYCFTSKTYGVSEKSIKTNRAAGSEKIYDIQKENAMVAQSAIYRAIKNALFSNGASALSPVGLAAIIGDAYESTASTTITALKSYAGITLTTAGVSAYNASYATMGFDNKYWYPHVISTGECPNKDASTPAWSTDAIYDLEWLANNMMRSVDVSGTGKVIKPDMAFVGTDPWNALIKLLTKSQLTYNIPLGTAAKELANFPSVNVSGLDVFCDESTPDDVGAKERAFVFDSKAFYIDTLNTKSEGLIEGEWKGNTDPEIIGGYGVYKSNMAIVCETPHAVGAILGCND
ncbi:MAG: hypothetical protein WC441_04890 [Patescibacteria group bacterium]